MPDRIFYEATGEEVVCPEEPAGPAELGDLLIQVRNAKASPPGFRSHLTDDNLRLLVNVAFFLSVREDEGRFPRLRIVSGRTDDSRLATRFSESIAFNDVHELRRVTPAAQAPDFALLVAESDDGQLCCPGLANIGPLGFSSLPGRPEIVGVGGPPSAFIWIEGPGHLYVSEGGCHLEYRAGRVRLSRPVITSVSFRGLVDAAAASIHEHALSKVPDISAADKYFGGAHGLAGVTHTILSKLFRTCMELRHGGAFVFVPAKEGEDPSRFGIEYKFPVTAPDLGEDLAEYWSTHITASSSKEKQPYEKALRSCNHSKARLLTNVEAIANLTAVDGCVVLNHELRVLGFGGKITVSEKDCDKVKATYKLRDDEEVSREVFLQNVGGQRHQSAARAVAANEGALAVVVSQDAEMSLFTRDADGFVRVNKPMDPWLSPSD